MPEFYICYLPEKYFFHEFWGQFPALKLRVSGLDPNTIRDHGGQRSTGAIVLNKLFMCLITLLYITALACDAVTKTQI